ncbi:hypothetical protein [uncultured Enterococcus sp.]|uniref:hypothetical protein n=1 Tax=uncultured Enterococcus sp. TaxID=167972 RepID=UPI002AA78DDA|nr:hypothetical protein [uncultured Enterococcus sp.]
MEKSELKHGIKEWLLRIDLVDRRPVEIIALNFGLFEPYGLELIGSKIYNPEDDDWACEEDFIPTERTCQGITFDDNQTWQEILSMVYSIIEELSTELSELELLRVPHITTGFSDGDLLLVK